jgi:peptidyl-prolyl cis-trans isomerase D
VGKTAMQVPVKDSLVNLPKGAIFGPYLDVNSFVMAKMLDTRMLPDSVKVRHILIPTVDPATQQPISDSLQKVRIDSIAAAIRNGASFDTLETRFTIDQEAHKTQGVMTFSSAQIQSENFAKEFGQFILFDGKAGDKETIKTQFGWHYIEIMEHKNVEPHYKIAYLAKKIVASEETNNEAINKATQFAGDSRDLETFNANADKLRAEGINKFPATNITAISFNIPGLQNSARGLIKLVFEADKGDVIGPERIGDNYVVAVVTDINEAGMQSVDAARPEVEPILKRKKQAAEIIRQAGQITTLEQVASKFNQQVQPSLDSLRFAGSNLSYEPRVLGAIFNPANKGKIVPEPVAGTSGVYVIRVDNQTTTPVESGSVAEQRTMLEMQAKQAGMNHLLQALKNAATIKDNRAEFY